MHQFLSNFSRLFYALEKDPNVHVLINVMKILQEFCTELGPASVDQVLEQIIGHIARILKNETHAQNECFEVNLLNVIFNMFRKKASKKQRKVQKEIFKIISLMNPPTKVCFGKT